MTPDPFYSLMTEKPVPHLHLEDGCLAIDSDRLLWYRQGTLLAIINFRSITAIAYERRLSIRHPLLGVGCGLSLLIPGLVGIAIVLMHDSLVSILNVYRGGVAAICLIGFGLYLLFQVVVAKPIYWLNITYDGGRWRIPLPGVNVHGLVRAVSDIEARARVSHGG